MKSKEVEKYIVDRSYLLDALQLTIVLKKEDCIHAVECAEVDRDAKAVEAHRICCHELRSDDRCHAKFDKWDIYSPYLPTCNSECKYMNDFIQVLDE